MTFLFNKQKKAIHLVENIFQVKMIQFEANLAQVGVRRKLNFSNLVVEVIPNFSQVKAKARLNSIKFQR